jgi:hypothetical protein
MQQFQFNISKLTVLLRVFSFDQLLVFEEHFRSIRFNSCEILSFNSDATKDLLITRSFFCKIIAVEKKTWRKSLEKVNTQQ